jgi:hypothetical protein
LPFEVTGRVQVGRFVFAIGQQGGTRAELAPGTPGADPSELAVALSQPDPPDALAEAEGALGEAESVTGRVERALDLFTAVAQGRVDQKTVLKEVDVLLSALERLDREGRHADVLRLARSLAGLLALLMRWVALVQALRMALRAARALGDNLGDAWAHHELGTFSLGAEDASAANGHLEGALRLREKIGDEAGVQATKHNLAVLQQAFPSQGVRRLDDGRSWPTALVIGAVVAGVLLLAAAGVGLAMILQDGDDSVAVDTVAPVVSLDEAPESPTAVRGASFAFSADEDVRTFECRLDGGGFQECVSPHNVPGPLDFGKHAFAVRAVDFAGNRGQPATHEWRVVRGKGPTATILKAPEPLTNDTTAEFTIEAPGATRLECSFDDEDFEACRTVVSRTVDEGDHIFVVRALDAEGTAGPPAPYRWTVDTTPPTVEIKSASRTSSSTAEVVFTPGESEIHVECVLLRGSDAGPVEVARVEDCPSRTEFKDLESEVAYVVRVTATDEAGNVGPSDEQEIKAWSSGTVE